ncbi:MAG TPA: hypothetical protein VJ817_01675 [Gemmatimonadales bacterium]|nr:hypothetical protein [Gemmatimonadales bacterium]
MSGHVFHPGHEELHGVTVVVRGASGRCWVGRYHERTARGILLHDVAIHDPATVSVDREAWLERLRKFGIKVDAKHVVIPESESARIDLLQPQS